MVEILCQKESATDERWKARCLDALDSRERLEHDAGARISQLSALLARLGRSLPETGKGGLGKRLTGLAETLKNRPLDPRLSREVDDVHSGVLGLMEANDRERTALLAALESAVVRLEPLATTRELRRQLQQFRNSLAPGRGALAASELVRVLGQLQGDLLPEEAAEAGIEQPDAGRRDPVVPVAVVPVAIAPAPAPASAPAPATVGNAQAPDGDPELMDWSAVRDVLMSMLARVELPAPLDKRLQQVVVSLEAGLDGSRLLSVLQQVRELFDAAISAMQTEFQGFLDSVDRRLDTLLSALGEAQQGEKEVRALEQGLADSMQAGLAAMQRESAGATALDQLKSSIDTHLACLRRSVEEFQCAGQSLGGARDERLEAMSQRLRELEGESRDARGQLEAQRRLALTDPLTGLPNRRALDFRLVEELSIWKTHGKPLSIAVADLDHFKRVNDDFGHPAGDRALIIFADIVRQRIRQSDFCARFGGEEFVLVFPGTGAEAAVRVVEQVREFVANCGFSCRGAPVAITASFGVTQALDGDDTEALLARADAALYAAKSSGRNRVERR